MAIKRAAIFAALFLFASIGSALAEDVTLTSRDGSVTISGNLVGYDGEFYRVDSVYGVLTIDGSGVVCEGPGCPDLQAFVAEFTISGARTMGEVLMPALVEAFGLRSGYAVTREPVDDTHFIYVLTDTGSNRPVANILFRVSSTAEGFADLLADEADITLSTRRANSKEIALAREAGIGDLTNPRRRRIVALDALVPIVSRDNPVTGVSLGKLAEVYAGEVENWTELEAPDGLISLHLRDPLSGLSQEFDRLVATPADKDVAEEITRHQDNAELTSAVMEDVVGLGVAVLSEIGQAKPLAIRGSCGRDLRATVQTVKSEDYPLNAPLFVYTPARRLPVLAREFLRYVRSAPAQAVVQRAGFVDLRLQEIPIDWQGQRLANAISTAGDEVTLFELQRLVERMQDAARLSLSFRFGAGGSVLDPQSQSNVEVLADQMERGLFDDRRLVFVGFSDGEGDAGANLKLARRRAEAVRTAVLRAAPTADRDRLDLVVDAFGEAMPMACDDTEWGRRINRRVEVWVQ